MKFLDQAKEFISELGFDVKIMIILLAIFILYCIFEYKVLDVGKLSKDQEDYKKRKKKEINVREQD